MYIPRYSLRFHGISWTRLRQPPHFLCEFQVDTPEVVAATLLEGLSDKKPKVPPACVGILIKALQLFGARAMPLKDLKAALPGICYGTYLENVERTPSSNFAIIYTRFKLHTPGWCKCDRCKYFRTALLHV